VAIDTCRCKYPKCGNLCGQKGQDRFIASWGQDVTYLSLHPMPPTPQVERVKGRRCYFAHFWPLHLVFFLFCTWDCPRRRRCRRWGRPAAGTGGRAGTFTTQTQYIFRTSYYIRVKKLLNLTSKYALK